MPTANLALVVVTTLVLLAVLSAGGVAPRVGQWIAATRAEAQIRRERLRQEQLKTAILEEELRNEILKDLHPRDARREPDRDG